MCACGPLQGVDEFTKGFDLSEEEVQRIRNEVSKYVVEADLRRLVARNIQTKIEIGCY